MKDLKILIVDDEERFLSTTKKLLLKNGYEALTAESGIQALEMLEKNLVHVVILDVKMPKMDGIETLREVKKQYPLVEVIMLTGHASVEDAVDGLKSGATDYLMKPTDVEELIQKAVASHESGRFEQRFLRPDGSTGHYFSTFQGIYDQSDNLVAIKGTVQDITERKQAEEKLRQRTHDLERFEKLAVGRELKMIALKKELKILQKERESRSGHIG